MAGQFDMAQSLAQSRFVGSFTQLSDLPPGGREVAVAGRSNAGKSSALNAITRAGLARVSKTPGRTQAINVFAVGDQGARLVDLPGYGYAAVPAALKARWQNLLADYLTHRDALAGLILVVDGRRGLGPLDEILLTAWGPRSGRLCVVLTKCDTLGRGAIRDVVGQTQARFGGAHDVHVQAFSSPRREGVEALQDWLALTLGKPY